MHHNCDGNPTAYVIVEQAFAIGTSLVPDDILDFASAVVELVDDKDAGWPQELSELFGSQVVAQLMAMSRATFAVNVILAFTSTLAMTIRKDMESLSGMMAIIKGNEELLCRVACCDSVISEGHSSRNTFITSVCNAVAATSETWHTERACQMRC